MKKIFSLLLICVCQVANSYGQCCMPQTCCYSPCDSCCDCNACCGCRPGFYVGAQLGYAWICTPDSGRFDCSSCSSCSECAGYCDGYSYDSHHCCGDRGGFAWGVFGGYNMSVCCDNLFVGIEGGYHGNGCANLYFKRYTDSSSYDGCHGKHHAELRSNDWNVSATVDYIICDCFDIFLKVGGARVSEKLKGHRKHYDDYTVHYCNNCHHKWAPVVDVGGGYCIWNCLKLTLSYRGVFCDNNKHVRDGFHIYQDSDGDIRIRLKECATIHSLYAGAVYTF